MLQDNGTHIMNHADNVDSGVSQGSTLGPVLFLFYINNMPEGLNPTVRLFADDTIVYFTVTSELDAQTLQAGTIGKGDRKWNFIPESVTCCRSKGKSSQ